MISEQNLICLKVNLKKEKKVDKSWFSFSFLQWIGWHLNYIYSKWSFLKLQANLAGFTLFSMGKKVY